MNKLYLNYEQVQGFCQCIARELAHDRWKPDYIVGLTRGGLLPANLLSQYLDVPMASLDVSLRDNTEIANTSAAWMADDALAGKKILIVDDINDSGATLDWIVDDWKSCNRPISPEWDTVFGENVRIATIVNNEASAFKDVNYAGLAINKKKKDVWIVFPWEEWWVPKR